MSKSDQRNFPALTPRECLSWTANYIDERLQREIQSTRITVYYRLSERMQRGHTTLFVPDKKYNKEEHECVPTFLGDWDAYRWAFEQYVVPELREKEWIVIERYVQPLPKYHPYRLFGKKTGATGFLIKWNIKLSDKDIKRLHGEPF